MTAVRLLLLNIINSNIYRVFRDEYFPFAQGLVRRAGGEVLRLFVGCRDEEKGEGPAGLVYDLTAGGEEMLAEHLRRFGPTHLLLNEEVTEASLSWLRRMAPRASIRLVETTHSECLEEWMGEWLGLEWPGPDASVTPVEEWVVPDYSGEPGNELAKVLRPHIHLLVGPLCGYRRAVADNPYYAGLDLSQVENPVGCAFCGTGKNLGAFPAVKDTVAVARNQLVRAYETADRGVCDWDFRIRGNAVLREAEAFAGMLEAIQAPPSRFFLSLRADELVAAERSLLAALPQLKAHGHAIVVWNMGVENFSPAENERLNKGVSGQTLRRCVALLRHCSQQWPQSFLFSEFGFILFTPWTRLEDLRINLQALKELGLKELDPFLGSTLLLLPNRAITLLAQRDGLLVERAPDFAVNPAHLASRDARVLPWRFADSRVGAIHQIVQRLAPDGTGESGHPLTERMRAWRRDQFGGESELAPVLHALVAAAEATNSSDYEVLMEAAGRLSGKRQKPEQTPPTTPMGRLAFRLRQALAQKPPLHPEKRSRLLGMEVQAKEGSELLLVRLAFGDEVVTAMLEALGSRPHYLQRGRRLGVWYREPAGPISSGAQTALVRLLVLAESLFSGQER